MHTFAHPFLVHFKLIKSVTYRLDVIVLTMIFKIILCFSHKHLKHVPAMYRTDEPIEKKNTKKRRRKTNEK